MKNIFCKILLCYENKLCCRNVCSDTSCLCCCKCCCIGKNNELDELVMEN